MVDKEAERKRRVSKYMYMYYCSFLYSGADIRAADSNSYTPLLTAAANGQVNAFRVLRERGAQLDILDRDSKSVVFVAAEANHVPILNVSVVREMSSLYGRESHFEQRLRMENRCVFSIMTLLSDVRLKQLKKLL